MMSNGARERVLANLRTALQRSDFTVPETAVMPMMELGREDRVARLKSLMEAMHTEVQVIQADSWVDKLKDLLRVRQLTSLLYAPDTLLGAVLERAWESTLPTLIPYAGDIEQFKDTLFAVDASITSTRGGIAETGALILWPDVQEPRLMSLVPPVHIAVLEADKIYNTFAEAIARERWQDGVLTNALLISGPSKTADIEFTLTFGVHGPKELIVLIVER
jgi:L-lactate dehydrogenase complex protein LldG